MDQGQQAVNYGKQGLNAVLKQQKERENAAKGAGSKAVRKVTQEPRNKLMSQVNERVSKGFKTAKEKVMSAFGKNTAKNVAKEAAKTVAKGAVKEGAMAAAKCTAVAAAGPVGVGVAAAEKTAEFAVKNAMNAHKTAENLVGGVKGGMTNAVNQGAASMDAKTGEAAKDVSMGMPKCANVDALIKSATPVPAVAKGAMVLGSKEQSQSL